MRSIKKLVKREMRIIPTQGLRLRKGKKMISKILFRTVFTIHIIMTFS
jgi:hypothetical protein